MATTTPRYEVTASKYRPKTFDELAGQEFVVSTIKNSLKSGHIAHAYLFSGPRGCGKTSAARSLARSLNCVKGTEAGPCGVCDNCIAISQGSSMDVIEIDGATHGKVDEVRDIKDEVLFPPQTGRFKVYIIDEVHMLSSGAFAALLKTIEEPPPYICFIFATTELHKVPSTIKSRCQQFNFRLISAETIQELLKKICIENNLNAEDDALFWIARESTGSMRDALTLFDQVVSFSDGNIRSELIREKLGIIGLDKLNSLADSCADNNMQKSFALIDEILDSGVAIERFIIDLTGYYRSLLLLKNGVTKESILGYRPGIFSSKALDAYDSVRLEKATDILLDCYRNVQYSVSPRFELEAAVSKLTWLNKWVSPLELKEALVNARHVLESGNHSVSVTRPDGPMPAGSIPAGFEPAGQPKPLNTAGTDDNSPSNEIASNEIARHPMAGGLSLAAEFERMVAKKEGTASGDVDDDDDTPMWGINKPKTENPAQVEQILSVIPGTVVP